MSVVGPNSTTITVEFSPTTDPLATPTWVDITGDVLFRDGITIRRGRSTELDEFRTGTASFTLLNTSRDYDPGYTSGPYYGDLLPMRKFRISATHGGLVVDHNGEPILDEPGGNPVLDNSATEVRLFTGFITDWQLDYDEADAVPTVPVTLVDGFELLRQAKLPGTVLEYEVLQDSPVIYWKLDKLEDNVALDASGNGHHGQYNGDGSLADRRETISFPNGITYTGIRLTGSQAIKNSDTAALPTSTSAVTYEAVIDPAHVTPVTTVKFSQLWGPFTEKGAFVASVSTAGQLDLLGGVGSTQQVANGLTLPSKPIHVLAREDSFGDGVYVDGTNEGTGTNSEGVIKSPTFLIGSGDGIPIAHFASFDSNLSSARITAHANAAIAPWDGDTTGERAGNVLDVTEWPAGDRNIDTGSTILGPQPAFTTDPLALLLKIAASEQGQAFMAGDGSFTFHGRNRRYAETESTSSQATFGEDGSSAELPYKAGGIRIERSRDQLRNTCVVTLANGGDVEVADSASVSSYGERTYTIDTFIKSANEARSLGEYIVDRYKDVQARIPAITVMGHRTPESGDTWTTDGLMAAVLGLEISDRVTVKRRPAGGTAVTLTELVEGMTHRFDTTKWETTFNLSPADTQVYAIWGTATWGTGTWGY